MLLTVKRFYCNKKVSKFAKFEPTFTLSKSALSEINDFETVGKFYFIIQTRLCQNGKNATKIDYIKKKDLSKSR